MHTLLVSCRAMHVILASRRSRLPALLVNPTPWEDLWTPDPCGWLALVRLLSTTVIVDPSRAAVVLQALPELAASPPEDIAEGSDDDQFLCGACERICASASACALHLIRTNRLGTSVRLRAVVISSVCPGCRLRCMHRLVQGARACAEAFQ